MMMGSCGKTISRHPQQIRKKAELCDLTTLDRPPNQPSSGEEWMLPLANGRPTNGQRTANIGSREPGDPTAPPLSRSPGWRGCSSKGPTPL